MKVGTRRGWKDYDYAVQFDKLGQAIRAERERRGWSRAVFGERAKLSPSALQEIEGGDGNPEMRTVARIAEALDVPLSALVLQAETKSTLGPSLSATSVHTDSSIVGRGAHAQGDRARNLGPASPDDLKLLQRVAIAILHLVGPPDV